jgi:hypothetical protein
VWARGPAVEFREDRILDLGRHDLFPVFRLFVTQVPGDPEDVGEHPFGESVPTYESLGDRATLFGQIEVPSVDGHVTLRDQAFYALGHRRRSQAEPLADPCLDHALALFFQLVDRLEVLLGGWVQIAQIGSTHLPNRKLTGYATNQGGAAL